VKFKRDDTEKKNKHTVHTAKIRMVAVI